jgi:hypothetical protein
MQVVVTPCNWISALLLSGSSNSERREVFFKYISFETGAVDVEPEKRNGISHGPIFNMTDFGGGFVPYLFQDIIVQNRNAQTVQVLTNKNLRSICEADIATLTFSSVQTNIGANWRSGGGPTSARYQNNRFYVIKDADNNVYKLRFTNHLIWCLMPFI